jgi:hypothetical protein
MNMQLKAVKIEKPDDTNFILGQTHFIKSVEDIHEALVAAVPGIKFGLAYCEASGKCLVRWSGTDPTSVVGSATGGSPRDGQLLDDQQDGGVHRPRLCQPSFPHPTAGEGNYPIRLPWSSISTGFQEVGPLVLTFSRVPARGRA